MQKENLPLYQIQDFEKNRKESGFYLSLLSEHLQSHTFIQKPHKHNFYIILLITRGSGNHTIDFVSYPVKPGAVFFLSPGQVHSWNLTEEAEGYICFFGPEFYKTHFPDKKLLGYPFFNPLLKPVLNLAVQEQTQVVALFTELKQEQQNALWKSQEVMGNLLDILLIRLARTYQKQNAIELHTNRNYPQLQQLEELIERHYKEHKPVSYYAEQMHTTTKQLNDSCRQSLGKTISELIQDRVLLEARRLLTHSELTITQIAAELGYFDNSYFSRFFRKKSGETPDQFRAKVFA